MNNRYLARARNGDKARSFYVKADSPAGAAQKATSYLQQAESLLSVTYQVTGRPSRRPSD